MDRGSFNAGDVTVDCGEKRQRRKSKLSHSHRWSWDVGYDRKNKLFYKQAAKISFGAASCPHQEEPAEVGQVSVSSFLGMSHQEEAPEKDTP